MAVDASQRTQGGSDMGRKTRRGKTYRGQGWKMENDFRNRYLFKLEEAMKREFPNTDLRVVEGLDSISMAIIESSVRTNNGSKSSRY
ncbi:hypothetical protein SASPL_135969 [Salvia splendens]|uniref:Uncharacterized protein n=1 Tax=Salvia splendens TaxID=180675 RepID=A0A8X8WXE1_SALSN|nr:hypothetical protein SASPL_135969 [Salvia splendens]